MIVQCVKRWMLSAFMFEHNDRAIILRRAMIRKGKYISIQRSIDGRIRLNEQIHAKMNSAIFVAGLITSGQGRRAIDITRFFDSLYDARRQVGFIILYRVTAEERTGNAQVNDRFRAGTEI